MATKKSYETPAAMYKMVAMEEALDRVLSHAREVFEDQQRGAQATEEVSVHECVGCVLAKDVAAPADFPDRPLSIMDGFAVKAGDESAVYTVVGENRAGRVDPGARLTAKAQACYITTGSPLPPGADAVVMIEDTEKVADNDDEEGAAGEAPRRKRVRMDPTMVASLRPWHNVREVGSDMAAGEPVLRRGKLLQPSDVGTLASLGIGTITVFPKPRAAFMSTGDEVVDVAPRDNAANSSSEEGGKGAHQIWDANRPILLAGARPYCSEVVDLGIAGDTQARLERLFRQATERRCQVLVTSGGVSMGDSDLIKPILESKGTVHFGKVKMKPGKPLTFATLVAEDGHKMMVFGLPGNPVSSFVTFNLVVLPVLRTLAGWADPHPTRIAVMTAEAIAMDAKRPEYHRAILSWGSRKAFQVNPSPSSAGEDKDEAKEGLVLVAHSTGNQRSSRLLSLRDAHCLLEVPQGKGEIPAGSLVSALLINDLLAPMTKT